MIVCNICGSVIAEPTNEVEEKTEETTNFKSKKETYRDEKAIRRPSLLSLPVERTVNGYRSEEIDVCETCRNHLDRNVNLIKYEFYLTRKM